jgi:hypothetical protein
LRDDVRARVASLALLFAKKQGLVQELLLSESDKLHYQKSGNLDRVMELTRDDGRTIDEINLVDFDIARAEEELCGIIGAGKARLYETLGAESEAGELARARERILESLGQLHRMRKELAARLESEAREVKESILALSRIDALKTPGPGDATR